MGFRGNCIDEVYVDIDTWKDGGAKCQIIPPSRIRRCLKSQIQQHKSPSLTPRYIQLANGLRALLISELKDGEWGGTAVEADQDYKEEEEATAEPRQEDDEGDSGEGTEEEEEKEEEEVDSDFEELNEEKEAGKRASSEKQSAAALCIAVGSFSDPEDLAGLAHFLEHMVFMGSEKYPAENGFDAFLKKHGGSDNASTDCERTIFQFDVQRKYFRQALDRWAQFFICPLMIEEAIEREVEAVDSGESLSLFLLILFLSTIKPILPLVVLPTGNAQTLKQEPKEKQINTYQRLRDFWKRFYSAHYMTLTVQSKETLDTLEEWVREIFDKVPNNGKPKPDFSHLQEPFETPAFNKMYRVVPVRKVHGLTLSWAVPPQARHYRVKPLHYISWLIGHEGKGSILSVLRKKCWALALFGGNNETGFDQNSTYSIFSISITLTDQGFQNVYEVVHLVFQYMKMLQTLGPQQRIYEEIQKIEANEFHYQEQTDPIMYVENICENMQLFPKEDFLTGDQLMFEYNPQVISEALRWLTPERANLLLLSPEHEGNCPLRERWFTTSYSIEDIPEEWAGRWKEELALNSDLHLPEENKFIATDFELRSLDCPDSEFPVKISSSDRGCLWYKKDNKFKIPKAYVRFHLVSPVIQKSPKSLVLFDLFVNILAHNLAEPAYQAQVAQLEYKLVAAEHGLLLRLKGFNHKLPLLLELLVDHLADFIVEEEVFSMFFQQMKKTYFNILINPERLARDVRLLVLEPSRWSLVQKYQALVEGVSVEDLLAFSRELKEQLYAEGLVQGNLTSTESKQILQYLTNKLQFHPLAIEVPVLFRVLEIPEKHHLCKIKSFNMGDANSEVTVYYQVTALVKLKECEDSHLGEEVDRHWFEVFTQQYVFHRLHKEIEALKLITKEELISWFREHHCDASRKLSVHVVGFGETEGDLAQPAGCGHHADAPSMYGEVSQLTFLPATSPLKDTTTMIMDIRAFTSALPLHPYHKILH
uniref:Nardilysin n=1 Tax=Gadus morhua TaxID=8049 RepID=A0A8C5A2Q6_GADMO